MVEMFYAYMTKSKVPYFTSFQRSCHYIVFLENRQAHTLDMLLS